MQGYCIVIVSGLSQVQVCLNVCFLHTQHRKEKGSQDLDFLEKVDDEMNKGESCTNQPITMHVFNANVVFPLFAESRIVWQ